MSTDNLLDKLLVKLVEMSNRYGNNEEYVLAGGGNTSFKENGKLYVKGSGVALSEITPEQFVILDLARLLLMIEPDYLLGKTQEEKEEQALLDMMAAKLPEEEKKRPSIESVLHAMFPFKYVLHVHPALINGLSCSIEGKEACESLFGDKVVWIDLVKPGLELALACDNAFNDNKNKTGKYPQTVILQNHGIFIAADTVEEIDDLMDYVVTKLKENIKEYPSFDTVEYDKKLIDSVTSTLKSLYSNTGTAIVQFCTNKQVKEYVANKESLKPISKSFTPDHIVNCKDEPLFIETGGTGGQPAGGASQRTVFSCPIKEKFTSYEKRKNYKPKIVALQGQGFFALSEDQKNSDRAKALFLDSIKIATYAKSFGGENQLTEEFTDFILSWEAEAYRSKA